MIFLSIDGISHFLIQGFAIGRHINYLIIVSFAFKWVIQASIGRSSPYQRHLRMDNHLRFFCLLVCSLLNYENGLQLVLCQ
jgi:hypothetical protein